MSYIQEQHDSGRKATIFGAMGVFTVYQTIETDNDGERHQVTASTPGGEPFVKHQNTQKEVSDKLYKDLCKLLGTGTTVIDLEDYADAEEPDEEEPDAEDTE